MARVDLITLKEKIEHQHEGDAQQLEVIFSEESRLIVEAPAGYGKTTTMVSRIAYLFAAGKIPNPKKVLALTFSVNAALKIKRDIAEKLPSLMGIQNNPEMVNNKVTATNYHGFCKLILRKYGYLLTPMLRKDVNLFKALGDEDLVREGAIKYSLKQDELCFCDKINNVIKSSKIPERGDRQKYLKIVSDKMLPAEVITHNAVLLYTLELLDEKDEIKRFYQNYYPLIIVDEFQDTNPIAWELLKSMISESSQLLFLGDSLQRIYGFIGALPDIMRVAEHCYSMKKITLDRNYRFRNNPEMLKLDANIRLNALTVFKCDLNDNPAIVPAILGKTQQIEARFIADKIEDVMKQDPDSRIAILCRGRGNNATEIEKALQMKGIDYFYGMFTDEDRDYIDFHTKCHAAFLKKFGRRGAIGKLTLEKFVEEVKADFASNDSKSIRSLLVLLDALVEKIAVDYATITPEDKFLFLAELFENKQLKQAMEYVSSKVILATVHGAKGLEWEYVFLPDMERWVFPGYICKDCNNKFANLAKSKYRCRYLAEGNTVSVDILSEELSVFYVAVTRARKQVFVSASAKRINNNGQIKDSGFSCLVNLNGIKLENSWGLPYE